MTDVFDKKKTVNTEELEDVVLVPDYVFNEIKKSREKEKNGCFFMFSAENGLTYMAGHYEDEPEYVMIECIRTENIEYDELEGFKLLRCVDAPSEWNDEHIRDLAVYICGFLDCHIFVTSKANKFFDSLGINI